VSGNEQVIQSTLESGAATPPPSKVRLALGGLAGTAIEYYDFFLYGTAAALVFNKLFFPNGDPFISTLLSFATLTVGFLARPLGAAVFGHFGDKLGRKKTLVASLSLMGVSTFAIAFLPTFETIGVAAPVILVCLRLVQGFALGGEWGGATLLLAENVDGSRRGFWASFPQVGPALGNLLAAGVLAIFSVALPEDEFLAWGWRIPFALSAVLLILGLWIRLKLTETKEFLEHQATRQTSTTTPPKIPFVRLITEYRKPLLIAIGFRLGESASYYICTVYILQYATTVGGMSRGLVLSAVLFGAAAECLLVPLFGALTDKIGRRPVYAAAAICVIPFIFFLFGMVDAKSTAGVVTAVVIGGVIHAAFAGTQGAYFSELFDTEVRYTGISLGFNIGAVLGGGLTPIIGLALYQHFGTSVAFSTYVSILALLTLVATLVAGETLNRVKDRGVATAQSLPVPASTELP
jgi:metabolite-proton symporter